MIYCPNCGTANRDGSKFCNECGWSLTQVTGARCPKCGASNPMKSIFCNRCGARIVPLTPPTEPEPTPPPIKGLSLPTKAAPTEEGEEEKAPPSWLAELRAKAEEEAPPEAEEKPEVPPEAKEEFKAPPEAEEELEAPPEAEEKPEVPSEAPSEEKAPPEEAPTVEEVEAPPELTLEEEVSPEQEAPLPEEAPPWLEEPELGLERVPVEELPEWLLEAEAPLEEAPPEWLEEAPPPEAEAEPTEAPPLEEAAPPEEAPVEAEIPPWVQALRPPELGGEPRPETVEEGVLAGIEGILPAEPLVAAPHEEVSPPPPPLVGEEEAALFREIVTSVPKPLEKAAPPRVGRWQDRVGTWLLYLLIFLAVSLPLIVGSQWPGSVRTPFSGVGDLFEAIQGLPEGTPVLVAFDYDASTAAEMDLVARALVHHLMSKKVRIVALTLLPLSSSTAQALLEEEALRSGYVYGRDYVNLGYLPGQMAGLRAFAASPPDTLPRDLRGGNWEENAALKGIQRISDFALVIELASGMDTLRWWIEQVGSLYGVRMGAGVAASLEPHARPYYSSGQLVGLISGLPQAAVYETLTGRPAQASSSMDALSLGLLALIFLILLGNLLLPFQRRPGK